MLWSRLVSLLVAAAVGVWAEGDSQGRDYKSIPLRTHSLSAPYLDSAMQSRWWDFGGDTIIRTDQYVRLTSDRPSQRGWIFSRVPLTATNWEIEFEFKIQGSGNLHGDGFALWLTKQRAVQGPVFGSTDNFEGLGIFFDTYKNNRPGTVFPYVMAMVGDGQTSYDQAHDGKANEIAGCSARGLRSASTPTKARLTYYQDKLLRLELQYKSTESWTECFELTKVNIPSVAYLGFSAETGELSDNHDIVSVSTKNLYSTEPYRRTDSVGRSGKGRAGRRRKAKTSWTWWLFKWCMILGVLVAVYIGWTSYRATKRHSRF